MAAAAKNKKKAGESAVFHEYKVVAVRQHLMTHTDL